MTLAQALAQSKSSAAGPKRELESGCLGYFDWSSVAAVTASPSGDERARSGAVVSHAHPPAWLLIVIFIAVVAFC